MKKPVIIIISIAVAAGLIGGALYVRNQNISKEPTNAEKITPPPTEAAQNSTGNAGQSDTSMSSSTTSFTPAELAAFNGKDGKKCYVAVNGTVYNIQQGTLWQNGEHSTSGGQAMCGADLSEAITKSPHGTSKLNELEIVGTFTK